MPVTLPPPLLNFLKNAPVVPNPLLSATPPTGGPSVIPSQPVTTVTTSVASFPPVGPVSHKSIHNTADSSSLVTAAAATPKTMYIPDIEPTINSTTTATSHTVHTPKSSVRSSFVNEHVMTVSESEEVSLFYLYEYLLSYILLIYA